MTDDNLKKSRISRLSAFGGLVAGLAGDMVGAASHVRAAGAPLEREFHQRAAKRLLQSLGQMRGLPMKFGQMLSYVDDMVPPEFRDIYRQTLAQLRVRTTPMRWETMSRVIEEEFGAPAHEIFDHIDEEPIAAASIGQVYRAVYRGRPVAVKVQYPGVAVAIDSDMKNAGSIISAMASLVPKTDVETSLRDISQRLKEECDYTVEARNQADFGRIWRGDAAVRIPEVIEARPRVLVTEFLSGDDWESLLSRATEHERNEIGRALLRFVYISLNAHGMFNADPHPGNYAFPRPPERSVYFFDFGCVQRFSREDVLAFASVQKAVLDHVRGPPLWDLLREAYGIEAPLDDEFWAMIEEYVLLGLEPISSPQPYRYGPDYTKRLTDHMVRSKLLAAKKVRDTGFWDPKRPGVVFLHRINYGVASLLARLEAEVDWPAIVNETEARRDAADSIHGAESEASGLDVSVAESSAAETSATETSGPDVLQG